MRARVNGIIILFLICAPSTFGQWRSEQAYRLTLPNKNWALDVSLAGFVVLLEEVKDDDKEYHLYATQKLDKQNPKQVVQLTVRLEPAQLQGSATDFRAFAIKSLGETGRAKKSSFRLSEHKHIPVVGYKIDQTTLDTPFGPLRLTDYNFAALDAFLVKDDVWITIVLAASPLDKVEEQLFYSILDSVKLTDTSSPSSSFDFYQLGRSLFVKKQYAKAAEPLAAALKLEQQQRQLNDSQWRYLVENLTNAYGAGGDITRAKEVLEYGISNDPTYPIFHLALARVYASLNNLDATIASLERAFLAAKNNAPDGRLPDPVNDQAFARFKKEEKFRTAVKVMKKQVKD